VRLPNCRPPAVAGPARAADRLRGGAGDTAAPGGAADRPRAVAPDGEADRPRVDADVADAAGGRPGALPCPSVASVPDAAAVLPIFVVAVAACSVLPAVDTAATLSVLSTRVTTPLTLALGCVGLADADNGTTVVDAAGAAGVAPSIASASVVTSEASRSSGAGVVIDVAGGRTDGGAPAAVVHVGCVATNEGGVVAADVDGGAAAVATAALAWNDDDPVFSPDPSAGTTPAMASASASLTAG